MGFLKYIITTIKDIKNTVNTVEKYKSMSNEELLALSEYDLYQAIVMVTELDVGGLSLSDILDYNMYQRVFYVLNTLNNKVMNGGLCQFFVNDSCEYASLISESLAFIGADKTKSLYDYFIATNHIDYDLIDFTMYDVSEFKKQCSCYSSDDFDRAYYEINEVYDLLLKFIRGNINELMAR